MNSLVCTFSMMIGVLAFSPQGHAQGNWMFSSDEPADDAPVAQAPKPKTPPKAQRPAAKETPAVKERPAAPPAAKVDNKVDKETTATTLTRGLTPKTDAPKVDAPKTEVPKTEDKKEVKKDEVPDGCSNDFRKASTLLKAVHGKDVELNRIGEFAGVFKGVQAVNVFKNSGGSLLLNLNIPGMLSADVPVSICKRGKRLTAQLITAHAREPNSAQPQQMIAGLVASGDAPAAITLNVRRSGGHLTFDGSAGQVTVQAAAAIR